MSKVKIQGNASGTGVFTIEAPGTNDPRTITLPDSTGTLLDENSSLPAANLTGDVATARLDVGTTANKLVQLDGSGNLPAVDGSSLTGISAGWSQGCDVTLSSNFSVTSHTVTQIQFNTETFDSGGNFASYTYTCPSAGKYFIMFRCIVGSAVANTRYESWVGHNGTWGTYSVIFTASTPGASTTVGHMTMGIRDLSANDTLSPYVWHTAGSSKNVIALQSQFSVYKIEA
jgi:hypothetical protein